MIGPSGPVILKLVFDNSVTQQAKAGLRSALQRDATSSATTEVVVVSSLSRVVRRPQTFLADL
jgi:hypothetical protein